MIDALKDITGGFILINAATHKSHAAVKRGDMAETACGIAVKRNLRGQNGGDFYPDRQCPLDRIECDKCLKNIGKTQSRGDKGFLDEERILFRKAIEQSKHVPTIEELEALPRVYAVLLMDDAIPTIREYYDHGVDWTGRRKIQARIPGQRTFKTSCQTDVYPTAYEAREAYLGKIRREIERAEESLEAKRRRLQEDSKALEEVHHV